MSHRPPLTRPEAAAIYGFLALVLVLGSWTNGGDLTADSGLAPLAEQSQGGRVADRLVNSLLGFAMGGAAFAAMLGGNSLRSRCVGWLLAVLSQLVLGVAVEYGQAWLAGRTSSWHDLLAQVLGAATGAGLVGCFTPLPKGRESLDTQPSDPPRRWRTRLLLLTMVALLWNAWPLDVVSGPDEIAAKWRGGEYRLLPESAAQSLAIAGEALFAFAYGYALTACCGLRLTAREAGSQCVLVAGALACVRLVTVGAPLTMVGVAVISLASLAGGLLVRWRHAQHQISNNPRQTAFRVLATLVVASITAVMSPLVSGPLGSHGLILAERATIDRRLRDMISLDLQSLLTGEAFVSLASLGVTVALFVAAGAAMGWVFITRVEGDRGRAAWFQLVAVCLATAALSELVQLAFANRGPELGALAVKTCALGLGAAAAWKGLAISASERREDRA
ncbi:hypothetical protein Mal64_01320 [Pseudobythopirellula maris]|uniref:VanZ like family protein n=1 Tax=Pseudobythopirellula maris TaxID=2527991 RepID=A0A5C5ZUB3_9BACT|nr:hypothetical protein Mal64_01320 [Pseudobythopirellula maris]